MRWAIVPLFLLSGCGSLGQVFVDAYVGPNIPLNQDVTDSSMPAAGDFDGIITGGMRGGFYLSTEGLINLGVALDVSASAQQIDARDFTLVPVSVLLMARSTFGAVEPYAAIGPSAMVSTVDLNTAVPDPTDETVDIGVDFRLGVTVMMWENLGIFGEYRLTYAEPDFDLTTQTLEVESLTNHFLVGLTLRF